MALRKGEDKPYAYYADRPVAFIALYVRRRAMQHAAIIAAVIVAVGCSVSTQYALKVLVDALSNGVAADSGVWLSFLLLVCLLAADNLFWRVAGWIISFTFVAVTGDLRRDLFAYLTGHSQAYFADHLPTALTSRVTSAANAVFAIENMFCWNVLPPCVATLASIAYLTAVSPRMTVGLLFIAVSLVVFLFRRAAAGKPLHRDFAEKAATVDGEMSDVIGNIGVVRAFGAMGREAARFRAFVEREVVARRSSLLYLEKLRLLHAAITILLTVGMLAWSILLWKHGRATVGDVVLVCTLSFTILHATRDLAIALVDVTQHWARLSEALSALLIPHDVVDFPRAVPQTPACGAIVFNDVWFSYPNGKRVFQGFNLKIARGERVGLIGPSGSGKSTVLSLLQRFYDVQSGRILVDGREIIDLRQENLRAAISVVPQDVSLLHRSILENIRYGRPDASDNQVFRAAINAKCAEFIAALPNGFATVVGNRGLKLSGGQRQRIAIARAFLKDAPVLLLDEATASLDTEAEKDIREALAQLIRDRTVIAISHRLSTLAGCSRIVVLQDGEIIEEGTPQALLDSNGYYRRLIRQNAEEASRATH